MELRQKMYKASSDCYGTWLHISTKRSPAKSSYASSGIVVGLGCLVGWRALLDGHETLDAELFACLLAGISPSLDVLVGFLAMGRQGPGHDLATLVLREVRLLQAARSLLPIAAEHAELLADLHGLHSLHGLHGLHSLHGLHRFHCFHGLHRFHGLHGESHFDKKQGDAEGKL